MLSGPGRRSRTSAGSPSPIQTRWAPPQTPERNARIPAKPSTQPVATTRSSGHNRVALWHEERVVGLVSRTDEELLAERRPGVAGAAFAEFYARHERMVLAYFARRVSRGELAADLAAETFAQALASRGRFRGGTAVGWLFGIAANVLSHSARRG